MAAVHEHMKQGTGEQKQEWPEVEQPREVRSVLGDQEVSGNRDEDDKDPFRPGRAAVSPLLVSMLMIHDLLVVCADLTGADGSSRSRRSAAVHALAADLDLDAIRSG
jgi:hypothetical protein